MIQKITKLLINLVKSVLTSIALAVLILATIMLYRFLSFEQIDDQVHVDAKLEYLKQITERKINLDDAPNILFIVYDDMGYGDIGAGADKSNAIKTPNIDSLASSGVMLSDFHSSAPVCTPARAGYLTGRIAPRAGLPNVVFPSGGWKAFVSRTLLMPDSNERLPYEEITVAEILKAAGYRTGIVGKWHLGDYSPSLPNDMGFDNFYGARYSNDNKPFALYRDEEIVVPAPADQSRLTEYYTREAISFIEAGDEKFFLYFAHNYPHIPLHVTKEHAGRSDAGLYGDVIEEIDDGIGEIVEALRRAGKLDNTLIIITSDNGPWYLGDAGNLRGRKGNTFEGGMRVPFIAHWPESINGSRIESSMAMGTDLLPTILDILDLPSPSDRLLDGRSILSVLTEGAQTPHDFLYFYDGETLFAVRDQQFKYRAPSGIFYSTDNMSFGIKVPQKEWLFDLEVDPREAYDASTRYPGQLQRLRSEYQRRLSEMEENKRGWHEVLNTHSNSSFEISSSDIGIEK